MDRSPVCTNGTLGLVMTFLCRASSVSSLLVVCFFLFGAAHSQAVPITGSNGRIVDFSGVKSAGPRGILVQLVPGGELVEVAWEKLDLEKLKAENPVIFGAFEAAKLEKITILNLGSFALDAPAVAMPKAIASTDSDEASKVLGRFRTDSGGGKFVIQLPSQEAPRAVLLLAIGQNGNSARFLGEPEKGRWSAMAKKYKLAVMAYEFPDGVGGRGVNDFKVAPFVDAESGSGAAVIGALENFAKVSGKPELAAIPVAVFGQDVLGAAFAFNFCQSFPDRVIAAVASKGAFYSVEPTDASAKVPLLILWGEYDDEINLWKPTDTHESVYQAALPLKPNWIYAIEPRGGAGETPQSHHLALTFLDRMILARLDAEGKLKDIDRTRSFVGDLDTFKISRMENDDAALDKTKTWLPDGEIGKLWEDFSNGVLELPASGN